MEKKKKEKPEEEIHDNFNLEIPSCPVTTTNNYLKKIKNLNNNKIYDETITALKDNLQEQKTHLSDFENFVKESINGIEKKYEEIQELNKQYFSKLDLLSSTLDNYMKENNELIETKEN